MVDLGDFGPRLALAGDAPAAEVPRAAVARVDQMHQRRLGVVGQHDRQDSAAPVVGEQKISRMLGLEEKAQGLRDRLGQRGRPVEVLLFLAFVPEVHLHTDLVSSHRSLLWKRRAGAGQPAHPDSGSSTGK